MEEYRVDIKVRNNLILTKIEQLGFSSPYDFCKSTNISYVSLLRFLNMKESIFDKYGKIKYSIHKLCETLKCIPEEIFSANQMEASLKDNKRSVQMGEAEVKFLMEQTNHQKLLEDQYQEKQLSSTIEDVLNTLPDREKMVIQMRRGLGDYGHEHTFIEIGKVMNITPARVRQVEERALRRLRHPMRSNRLKEFLPNEE